MIMKDNVFSFHALFAFITIRDEAVTFEALLQNAEAERKLRVRSQIAFGKNEPSRLARSPNSKVKNEQALSF